MHASPFLRAFFDSARGRVFGGKLSAAQVEGTELVIRAWEEYGDGNPSRKGIEGEGAPARLAYVLATAYHETAHTMQPVREIGRGQGRAYGQKHAPTGPGSARRVESGHVYYGRGHVQLTWEDNYRTMSRELGVDLVGTPDLALDPAISARVLVVGMQKGLFTGRALNQYVRYDRVDFAGARRVVNGVDRAEHIAGLARGFLAALEAGALAHAVAPPAEGPPLAPLEKLTPKPPAELPGAAPAVPSADLVRPVTMPAAQSSTATVRKVRYNSAYASAATAIVTAVILKVGVVVPPGVVDTAEGLVAAGLAAAVTWAVARISGYLTRPADRDTLKGQEAPAA